jgi:hypothetical protein
LQATAEKKMIEMDSENFDEEEIVAVFLREAHILF